MTDERIATAMEVLRDPELTEQLVDQLFREHRTHQQQMIRGVLAVVEEGASAYARNAYDQRNEDAMHACHDAVEGMYPLPERFPYI